MQMRLQLYGTGKNHRELAITIIQHLKQGKTRKTDPQVKAEHTTTIQSRPKTSNTLHNHQEPYKNYNNHAKIATPTLTWQESSGNGHNQLPGSK